MDTARSATAQPVEPLLFEEGSPGREGASLPELDVPGAAAEEFVSANYIRKEPPRFPELSELDVVRHFTRLSQLNYSIDTHFYPLGSCTMKYNPKVFNVLAGLAGFARLHPYQPEETLQGILEIFHEVESYLCEATGMDAFSLQPSAGAQGELLGMLVARAHFLKKGEPRRRKIIIPDSAHGTNPASAALCGFEVVEVRSNDDGRVDRAALAKVLDDEAAVLMLTNPNTLGLFEEEILEIAAEVHRAGALLYLDGANMNALLGIVRAGDMGFDMVHLNLHKTFATPHGGGGPGAGPLGVKAELAPYLPVPRIIKEEDRFRLSSDAPDSVGRVRAFLGNALVIVRAFCYIRALGAEGLARVSEHAILNANYLRHRLKAAYPIPFNDHCMHEFVIRANHLKAHGVRALDIAKRLLDYGFYAPTIYFPLIVEEAIMVEPTETESKETLDAFAEALLEIARDAAVSPERILKAPSTCPVRRLDEVKAAREPQLNWYAAQSFQKQTA